MKNDIIVRAKPSYVPERSSPIQSYFLFSYLIEIRNKSTQSIKLLSRHWHIKDGSGVGEDIFGPGVVGKTPTINPQGIFSYSSFCPLKTPIGSMEGSYVMANEKGEEFSVEIPLFRLTASQVLN
jgi:ApaG protein